MTTLKPKVWWIQIGTNDLEADECSSESVAAAILPLVQEIQRHQPYAKVVVNSIIPNSSEASRPTGDEDDAWRRLWKTNEYLDCMAQNSNGDFEFFNSYNVLGEDVYYTGSISLTDMQSWGESVATRVLEICGTSGRPTV